MNTDYPGRPDLRAERLRRVPAGPGRALQPAVRQRQPRRRPDAADDRAVRVVAVHEGAVGRHRAGHRLPALQGQGPAGVRQPGPLDQPGQRHQQRPRQLVGRGRARRLHGPADRCSSRSASPMRARSAWATSTTTRGSSRRAAASTSRRASPPASRSGRRPSGCSRSTSSGSSTTTRRRCNNPSALICNCAGRARRARCLGGSNGAGFGWQNVDVLKIGVQYMLNDSWTLRAGYNHTAQPDRAAGRDVQHPRAGRRAEPVVGGHDLPDRPAVRGHRLVHVRSSTTR